MKVNGLLDTSFFEAAKKAVSAARDVPVRQGSSVAHRKPCEATGVYVRCTGSRTCEGIHFFDVAKERGSWRQGRSRKGPPAALEKLPSMLLKRWVLLLDQCATCIAVSHPYGPAPLAGPPALQEPREATGVYVPCTGSRSCDGIHFFEAAKQREFLAPGTFPKRDRPPLS